MADRGDYFAAIDQTPSDPQQPFAAETNPEFADHDRVCSQGDGWGGVFIAKHKDNVRYKMCVNGPGVDSCHSKRTDKAGEKSGIAIADNDERGRFRFKWRVPGKG